MSDFQSGKRDGYIYGYIFLSENKGLVLDEGPNEYPIDAAEFLINGKIVLLENLTIDSLKSKGLYGSRARIKENELVENFMKVNKDEN